MKIYTSYFANLKNIDKNIVPISICAKCPPSINLPALKILAPSYEILMTYKQDKNKEAYTEKYNKQILAPLDPQCIYNNIEAITEGKDAVLICYEKPESFCHRHLVAS